MIPSYEQKYKYLLSKLYVSDVDLWEKDATVSMSPIYYQFWKEPSEKTIDEIIEANMKRRTHEIKF